MCVCGSVSQSRTSNNIIASGLSPIGNKYKEDAAARILQRGDGISCKTRPHHLSLSESWQNPAELPELPFLKSVPGWEKAVSLAPGIYRLGQHRQARRYGAADWSGTCGWWLVDKVGLERKRAKHGRTSLTPSQTRITSLSTAITTSVTFLWSSPHPSSPPFAVCAFVLDVQLGFLPQFKAISQHSVGRRPVSSTSRSTSTTRAGTRVPVWISVLEGASDHEHDACLSILTTGCSFETLPTTLSRLTTLSFQSNYYSPPPRPTTPPVSISPHHPIPDSSILQPQTLRRQGQRLP